jgi:ferrochelatase
LEEIAIRAGEQWKAKGGEELRLIPSLNSDPNWAKALASMLRTTISPPQ